MAIIKQFMIGNTKILIDDTYLPKTEEEKQKAYQEFNRVACEILIRRYYGRDNEKAR